MPLNTRVRYRQSGTGAAVDVDAVEVCEGTAVIPPTPSVFRRAAITVIAVFCAELMSTAVR